MKPCVLSRNQTNHSGFFYLPLFTSRFILNLVEKVEILVSATEKEKQGNKFKSMYITFCKYVYTSVRVVIQSELWLSLNQRPHFELDNDGS